MMKVKDMSLQQLQEQVMKNQLISLRLRVKAKIIAEKAAKAGIMATKQEIDLRVVKEHPEYKNLIVVKE